jgi:hypothetical protein
LFFICSFSIYRGSSTTAATETAPPPPGNWPSAWPAGGLAGWLASWLAARPIGWLVFSQPWDSKRRQVIPHWDPDPGPRALGFTIMCLFRMPGASSGAWIRFVSLGLNWSHFDSDALTWIHYHVSFSDAWLIIGCSACICKACLRQAFFFNKTHVGCLCPMSGSGVSSCLLFWIRLSHLVSVSLIWFQMHSLRFTSMFFFGCLA